MSHQFCAALNCEHTTVGKSKYCFAHRAEARRAFREKCAADTAEREARYAKFAQITADAHTAGMLAGEACQPVPMVIRGYESTPVLDGPCGFATVTVKPGNSSYAIWAKKNAGFGKAYYGGVSVSVHAFNQSHDKKLAFARAFAQVLQDNGINAFAQSRLD